MLWDLEEQRHQVSIGTTEFYILKGIDFNVDFKENEYCLNKLGEGTKQRVNGLSKG